MARMSKKEIRLLVLFLSSIFVALNAVGIKRYLDGVKLAKAQIETFTQQKAEIDALLSDRYYWEERAQWMEIHQPRISEPGEAQGELIAVLQQFARDRGITILEQTIMEPAMKQPFHKIAVRLKLSAPMRDMVEWLAEIQSPDSFYVVEHIQLNLDTRNTDSDEQPVVCTFQVAKLYRSKGGDAR